MTQNNNIIDVNEAEFSEKVINASQDKLVIVDFWAPWCGPCKQLTPLLEKVINNCGGKVLLVKINIDDNQGIAGQLRIQSIPTVYAFKDKQIVNAFQGVIPEKQIIEFIEKSLGSKINEDFTDFYEKIKNFMSENKFEEAKEILLEFISDNSQESLAISYYVECLIELEQLEEVDSFLDSLDNEIKESDHIKKVLKKIEVIKQNLSGPDLEELVWNLKNDPNNVDLIIDIAGKYFSKQDYQNCMNVLLENYSKDKNKIKSKMVEYFNILGDANEHTIFYRKKLSQIIFS